MSDRELAERLDRELNARSSTRVSERESTGAATTNANPQITLSSFLGPVASHIGSQVSNLASSAINNLSSLIAGNSANSTGDMSDRELAERLDRELNARVREDEQKDAEYARQLARQLAQEDGGGNGSDMQWEHAHRPTVSAQQGTNRPASSPPPRSEDISSTRTTNNLYPSATAGPPNHTPSQTELDEQLARQLQMEESENDGDVVSDGWSRVGPIGSGVNSIPGAFPDGDRTTQTPGPEYAIPRAGLGRPMDDPMARMFEMLMDEQRRSITTRFGQDIPVNDDPMLVLLRALPPTRRAAGPGGFTIIRTSGPNGGSIEFRSGGADIGEVGGPDGLHNLLFGMLGRGGLAGMGAMPPNMSYEELLALAEQLGPARPPGATPEMINSLPTVTYKTDGQTKDKKGQTEDMKACAICLEDFKDGDKVNILPKCTHQFHAECAKAWLERNRTCPVCRADIQTNSNTAATSMPSSSSPRGRR